MTSLQDILNGEWNTESVKTASAQQVATQNTTTAASDEQILKLATDLGIYGAMFPEDVAQNTKTAEEVKIAEFYGAMGERSFDYFELQADSRFRKIAGEILAAGDMEAAQNNLGLSARPPVAIPTNQDPVGDKSPMTPVGPGATPYSLVAGQEAGAEGAEGHEEQHKIAAATQKHLIAGDFDKLSADLQALVNYDFGEEIEKIAAARAESIASAYEYGLTKFAEQKADEMDEEEEKKKEKDEDKKSEKMDHESEKAAAELGAFIERGFFDGLRKLGSDRHGDEFHYIAPFLEEKVAAGAKEMFANVLSKIKGVAGAAGTKAKDAASAAGAGMKDYHKGMADNARSGIDKIRNAKNVMDASGSKVVQSKFQQQLAGAKDLGLAGAKALPHAAALTALGYGGSKAFGKKDQGQG